jgi:hypothetical protein
MSENFAFPLNSILLTAMQQRFTEDLFGGAREHQGRDEVPLQEERYSVVTLLGGKVKFVIGLISHLS